MQAVHPLILADGVPRAMNDIEADEIDSFTVPKDVAATAVYGAKVKRRCAYYLKTEGHKERGFRIGGKVNLHPHAACYANSKTPLGNEVYETKEKPPSFLTRF